MHGLQPQPQQRESLGSHSFDPDEIDAFKREGRL